MWNLKKPQAHRYKQFGGCQEGDRKEVGVGETGEGTQKIPSPSSKVNMSWGCQVQHGDYC